MPEPRISMRGVHVFTRETNGDSAGALPGKGVRAVRCSAAMELYVREYLTVTSSAIFGGVAAHVAVGINTMISARSVVDLLIAATLAAGFGAVIASMLFA